MLPLQWSVTALCRKKWQFGALLFEFKLSGSGVTALCWYKGVLKGHYYLQRAVTPDQPAEWRSAQKAEKALSGLISRPILDLDFILKPMSPQDTGRQLWGNPGIVSLRQFRNNEAWIQLGQESPLMNKKGLIRLNLIKSMYVKLLLNL